MEIIGVPMIVAFVYAIIELLKSRFGKNLKFLNFIPIIAGVLGAVLGVVLFYSLPAQMPVDNFFSALFLGLFSGLSATGSNQIIKQMNKLKNSEIEEP